MKKSVLAGMLAAVMLLSGCSGVSQDEYNSLLEEKARLETENSSLQSTNSKLESEKSKATSENTELQGKVTELEKQNSENATLMEELQENNVPLEIVDILLLTFAHSENEILSKDYSETLQQYIYSNMAVCHIINTPTYLPPKNLANIIKGQETSLDTAVDLGASSYAMLFKSYDRKNVACFWTDGKQSGWIWFDKDVKAAYDVL